MVFLTSGNSVRYSHEPVDGPKQGNICVGSFNCSQNQKHQNLKQFPKHKTFDQKLTSAALGTEAAAMLAAVEVKLKTGFCQFFRVDFLTTLTQPWHIRQAQVQCYSSGQ